MPRIDYDTNRFDLYPDQESSGISEIYKLDRIARLAVVFLVLYKSADIELPWKILAYLAAAGLVYWELSSYFGKAYHLSIDSDGLRAFYPFVRRFQSTWRDIISIKLVGNDVHVTVRNGIEAEISVKRFSDQDHSLLEGMLEDYCRTYQIPFSSVTQSA
jgi:hypothetical protein